MSEKAKDLKKKLFAENKNGTFAASEELLKAADEYAKGYIDFLGKAKTERLAVKEAVALAKAKGFDEFVPGKKYSAGDKVYVDNHGKAAIFAVIGKQPVECGMNITAAHVDSPRLDLKPNPLYESNDLGYLKTHYYGGIKNTSGPRFRLPFTALS